ncbi:hypothetical protein A9Q91_03235 [Candidatus Gracilibacteria bacterium 28_42_T64]|nr:hypothetical protein A9Q91_03235 [Candidatus Gracilibacteria bacterium 28_42_T64]
MIYHFTGNSDYLIKNQLSVWKNHFIEKHGEFNFLHIKSLLDCDNNFLNSTLTSGGFLAAKKLIVIDLDFATKDSKIQDKHEFILTLTENVPEENILVFISLNPDKRSKIYKGINKISEIKEFNTNDDNDIKIIIQKKYGNSIETDAIYEIIKYKSGNLSKIISELDKIFITRTSIIKNDITEIVIPELEESIFQLIDNLLNLNIPAALKTIDIILNNTNSYAFYNNLLANLRTSIYIFTLKSLKLSTQEINSTLSLGNRGFLITKNYKISHKKLSNFYLDLISLDKKMKSGKLIGSEDSDLKLEIEKCILKLI